MLLCNTATSTAATSTAPVNTTTKKQTVIAQTVAFFENGSAPVKGLDEIDRLLMRKRHMLRACGPAESHRINAYAFSDALLCAVRVTVMNESDVDVLCPRATGCVRVFVRTRVPACVRACFRLLKAAAACQVTSNVSLYSVRAVCE